MYVGTFIHSFQKFEKKTTYNFSPESQDLKKIVLKRATYQDPNIKQVLVYLKVKKSNPSGFVCDNVKLNTLKLAELFCDVLWKTHQERHGAKRVGTASNVYRYDFII